MDSARFDGLVRRFGQTRSRRQTLRDLAAIAASGALALSGRAVSAQDCKPNGQVCKKPGQCCSGNCAGGTGAGATSKSEGICAAVCTHGQVADGAGGCTCAAPCSNGSAACSPHGTTEGCLVCTSPSPSCGVGLPSCVTSADCASNEVCASGGPDTCGVAGARGVCVPLCSP